jgi:hypothetical protein
MTDKLTELRVERCVNIPDPLEPGILYVSDLYRVAIHLCPCGCGTDVVTPFWEAGPGPEWQISGDETTVTLSPSILVRSPCQSHYFIRENRVEWVVD